MIEETENINAQIGKKLKERRKLLGFSPQHLASLLGISYQQLYKYENGTNRISAGTLGKASKILNIPIQHFFQNNETPYSFKLNDSFKAAQLANEPETKSLVKNYIAIPDYRVRIAVSDLVSSVTKYVSRKV